MDVDVEILVALIIVPIYAVGFATAGILGFRAQIKDPLSNTWFSFSNLAGVTEDDETELESRASTMTMYFRTDSFSGSEKGCCNTECQETFWNIYEFFIIMSVPCLSLLDHLSDYMMTVHLLQSSHSRLLGFISIAIIILQRLTSAMIMGNQYGLKTGVRQFFDVEVFHAVYNSIKHSRTVLEIMEMKILEGFYESLPSLCIQTYYLVNESDMKDGFYVYFSITISLLSLSKCWLFSDEMSIGTNGFSCSKFFNGKEPSSPCGSKELKKDDDNNFLTTIYWFLGMMVMWTWRFGEITITVSTLVIFGAIVCARCVYGVFGLALLWLIALWHFWPVTRKSSWFYQVYLHHPVMMRNKPRFVNSMSELYKEDSKSEQENWAKIYWLYHSVIKVVIWFAELNFFF